MRPIEVGVVDEDHCHDGCKEVRPSMLRYVLVNLDMLTERGGADNETHNGEYGEGAHGEGNFPFVVTHLGEALLDFPEWFLVVRAEGVEYQERQSGNDEITEGEGHEDDERSDPCCING